MSRDMTSAQFEAALKRNGFKYAYLFWFKDITGQAPDYSFPGVFLKNGKTLRRATIAHLIKCRERAIKEKENAA